MRDEQDLQQRTKVFALRVIRLYGALPKRTEARAIGEQILRSGTSGGALFREAKRARSNAEFISKIESSPQELEETLYWLELLSESALLPATKLSALEAESNELLAILVTVVKNAKSRSHPK